MALFQVPSCEQGDRSVSEEEAEGQHGGWPSHLLLHMLPRLVEL